MPARQEPPDTTGQICSTENMLVRYLHTGLSTGDSYGVLTCTQQWGQEDGWTKKSESQISSSWQVISELRGVTEVWCRTILLAAWHKRAHLALTPAGEGWYSIYLPRRDGRLSWPREYVISFPLFVKIDWDALIMPWAGTEPTTTWSKDQCPNHCATKTRSNVRWIKSSKESSNLAISRAGTQAPGW